MPGGGNYSGQWQFVDMRQRHLVDVGGLQFVDGRRWQFADVGQWQLVRVGRWQLNLEKHNLRGHMSLGCLCQTQVMQTKTRRFIAPSPREGLGGNYLRDIAPGLAHHGKTKVRRFIPPSPNEGSCNNYSRNIAPGLGHNEKTKTRRFIPPAHVKARMEITQ